MSSPHSKEGKLRLTSWRNLYKEFVDIWKNPYFFLFLFLYSPSKIIMLYLYIHSWTFPFLYLKLPKCDVEIEWEYKTQINAFTDTCYVNPNNMKTLFWIFSLYHSFSWAILDEPHSPSYRLFFNRLYSLPQGPSICVQIYGHLFGKYFRNVHCRSLRLYNGSFE